MQLEDPTGKWQVSIIEKAVGATIIGLLFWMAVSVQQMSVDIAVLKNQFQMDNKDRFTAEQGQRLNDRIGRVEERVTNLEH